MSNNLSAKYYQDNKERITKKAHERYWSLSTEEKEKKQQNGHKIQKSLRRWKTKAGWV